MSGKRKPKRQRVWLQISPASRRDIYERLLALRSIAERYNDNSMLFAIDSELKDTGYYELSEEQQESVEAKRQHAIVRKCVFRIHHLYETRKKRGEPVHKLTSVLHPMISLIKWMEKMEQQSRKEESK